MAAVAAGPVQRRGVGRPADVIDVHAHVLPGIDDGPADWDEALALVSQAHAHGVTAMAVTPHMYGEGEWANERDDVLPLVDELKRRLQEAGLAMTIVPGGEVQLTPDLMERIETGRVLTYGDQGKYLLLELPWTGLPINLNDIIFQLGLRGMTPVIAHPERYHDVRRRPEIALEWVEHGALLQMNVGSLRDSGAVGAAARQLLSWGAIHVVASDAHGIDRRPPLSPDDAAQLEQLVGEAVARRLLWDHPAALLAGKPVSTDGLRPAAAPAGSRWQSWMERWRRSRRPGA